MKENMKSLGKVAQFAEFVNQIMNKFLIFCPSALHTIPSGKEYFKNFLKYACSQKTIRKGDLCQFPAIFMREKEGPLIGQAAHGRRAGIILLTAWPIRGPFLSLIKMAGN